MNSATNGTSTEFVIERAGRNIYVEVSPCSWMYQGYGLQIRLSTVNPACNAESIFDRNKAIDATKLSRAELVAEAKKQAHLWLKANGTEKLDRAIANWKKTSKRLLASIRKEQAKEEKLRLARLKNRQAKGYTHVIDGWIHPKNGGDDYRFEACTQGIPTTEDIRSLLAESDIKTDYKVHLIADILNPSSKQ